MWVNSVVLSVKSTFYFPFVPFSSLFFQKQYILNCLYFCLDVFSSLTSNPFSNSHNWLDFMTLLLKMFKNHVKRCICFLQGFITNPKIPKCIVSAKKIVLEYVIPEREATAAPPSVYSRCCSVLHCALLPLWFYYRAVDAYNTLSAM